MNSDLIYKVSSCSCFLFLLFFFSFYRMKRRQNVQSKNLPFISLILYAIKPKSKYIYISFKRECFLYADNSRVPVNVVIAWIYMTTPDEWQCFYVNWNKGNAWKKRWTLYKICIDVHCQTSTTKATVFVFVFVCVCVFINISDNFVSNTKQHHISQIFAF